MPQLGARDQSTPPRQGPSSGKAGTGRDRRLISQGVSPKIIGESGGYLVKSVQLKLPDPIMTEVDGLIHEGWFRDKNELVRTAVVDFVRRHRFALIEKSQREDIAWALKQKGKR